MTLLPSTTLPEGVRGLESALLWQVLNTADIGLLVTDAQRRIVYVNATFTRETGYSPEEVLGRSCSFLQGPDTSPADVQAMRDALDRYEPIRRVVLNYRKDGSTMWYRLSIQPLWDDGVVRYFVGVQEDYSETHTAHVQLERLAHLDALTGLGNRRAFDVRLAEQVAQGLPLTLALLDLDDFKQVNDRHGHPAGDALLAAVGRGLTHVTSSTGRAYRVGGDEFAVVFPNPASDVTVCTALRAALQELEGGTLRAGLGTARFPEEAADVPSLLRLADRRLYADKALTKRETVAR